MLKELTIDIFKSNADVLVNPVNCVGVMSAGVAKQFKWRYPIHYTAYRYECYERTLRPGSVKLTQTDLSPLPCIVCFPTKDDWRDPSKLEFIIDGLHDLKNKLHNTQYDTIAMPRLGCGCGGLKWKDVRPHILHFSQNVVQDVVVCTL